MKNILDHRTAPRLAALELSALRQLILLPPRCLKAPALPQR